ncbi:MAG: S-layer homology domain-containing protein [Leptolyngbyaceae cyanobacterium MO_188.B28]|nr:S-layer homology domain-containing protein [Leptolyngbyaceae cyanobacterium MO_188.B28]
MSPVLYINPRSGRDQGPGSQQDPYRTISYALRQVQAGARLQLAAGVYNTANREVFPLIIPIGVIIIGNTVDQGQSVLITGSGLYDSPSFNRQQVTIVLQDRAQLTGVTVTNLANQGKGVWIESAAPVISNCRLIQSKSDGVFITGNALPLIQDSLFSENGASGLHIVRNGKGEIRRNTFRRTGYGVAVGDEAAPLLEDNHISENQSGVVISRSARPVLRKNRVENNQKDGLLMQASAFPDIGQRQDLGQNIFRNNRDYDVRNETTRPLLSAGNDINPNRIRGRVTFVASQIPDRDATPAPLLSSGVRPESSPPAPPSAAPPRVPPAPVSSTPTSQDSQFADLVGHWAAPFVADLAKRKIIKGFADGTFRPNQPVTRAQFATLVVASFSPPPSSAAATVRRNVFKDLEAAEWARNAILQAHAQGFLSGFPDGSFRPQRPLQRIQAIVALASGLRLAAGNTDILGIYHDRGQIPDYAMDALAAATQQRLVVNYPRPLWLRPLEATTRAEAAALIYQGLTLQGKAPLMITPYLVQPDTSQPLFNDTTEHWAADFIRGLTDKDLISGYQDGGFKPDDPITRAQYASLLVKALQPRPQRPERRFIDVPPTSKTAAAIQTAYQAKFMSGFPDFTFGPDQKILRVQVLVSLVNGLGLLENASLDSQILTFYEDRLAIPDYARSAVAKATQLGLAVNYPNPNQLNPNRTATRAEVATMVYQAMTLRNQVPSVNSIFIAKP